MLNNLFECCHINDTYNFDGNWNQYEENLINYFYQFMYNQKIIYSDKKVSLRRHPEYNDNPGSFYHLTCKGNNTNSTEEEREPDLRRCERLHWIKPIIEEDHENLCPKDCVRIYEKRHNGDNTINFLFEEGRFLVVLAKRNGYYLLKTAFYIEYDNRLKREIKAYEDYIQKST